MQEEMLECRDWIKNKIDSIKREKLEEENNKKPMITFTTTLTEVVERYSKALISPMAQASKNFLDNVDSPDKFKSIHELVEAYSGFARTLADLADPDTAGAAIKKLCSEGAVTLLVSDVLADQIDEAFMEASINRLGPVDFVVLVEDDETGEYVGTISKNTIMEAYQ